MTRPAITGPVGLIVVAGLCWAWMRPASVAAQEPAPAFRASADAVRVDVSVRQAGRPVVNLGPGDFELQDRGVVQRITDLSFEKMPIDVTIAFDVSRSVTGAVIAELRRAVDQVRGRLRPGDRLKLLTFNMRVTRLLDFSDSRVDTTAAFNQIAPAGSTALFDAMAVALSSPAPADRRQLIVVFSDGQETSSVSDQQTLLDVARHTTPALAFVVPLGAAPGWLAPSPAAGTMTRPASEGSSRAGVFIPPTPNTVSSPAGGAAPWSFYRDLAAETGGLVVPAVSDLALTFTRVLDEFRSVYVMNFSPQGVAAKGFHDLKVRVTRSGNYEVRARRGYTNDAR